MCIKYLMIVHPHDAIIQIKFKSCFHLLLWHPEALWQSSGTFSGMHEYKGANEVMIGVEC